MTRFCESSKPHSILTSSNGLFGEKLKAVLQAMSFPRSNDLEGRADACQIPRLRGPEALLHQVVAVTSDAMVTVKSTAFPSYCQALGGRQLC